MYNYMSVTTTEEARNSTSSPRTAGAQSPESEGDPESGFSSNWVNAHVQRAERRSREIRQGSGDSRFRPSQQQQQQQQEQETITEEEES